MKRRERREEFIVNRRERMNESSFERRCYGDVSYPGRSLSHLGVTRKGGGISPFLH